MHCLLGATDSGRSKMRRRPPIAPTLCKKVQMGGKPRSLKLPNCKQNRRCQKQGIFVTLGRRWLIDQDKKMLPSKPQGVADGLPERCPRAVVNVCQTAGAKERERDAQATAGGGRNRRLQQIRQPSQLIREKLSQSLLELWYPQVCTLLRTFINPNTG